MSSTKSTDGSSSSCDRERMVCLQHRRQQLALHHEQHAATQMLQAHLVTNQVEALVKPRQARLHRFGLHALKGPSVFCCKEGLTDVLLKQLSSVIFDLRQIGMRVSENPTNSEPQMQIK